MPDFQFFLYHPRPLALLLSPSHCAFITTLWNENFAFSQVKFSLISTTKYPQSHSIFRLLCEKRRATINCPSSSSLLLNPPLEPQSWVGFLSFPHLVFAPLKTSRFSPSNLHSNMPASLSRHSCFSCLHFLSSSLLILLISPASSSLSPSVYPEGEIALTLTSSSTHRASQPSNQSNHLWK